MKAVAYQKFLPAEHPESLLDVELPAPEAQSRDLLVRVEAVSVNPVDTKVRVRKEPAEGDYQVLGWDAAGVVEAVGAEVTLFQPGDKVYYAGALDRPGSNSELHLVDERIAAKMPESLDFAQAAALPLTTITAWEILFDRLGFTAESTGTLLVIGAAGGVGSIMIQLAKQLTRLTVIGTSSREETKQWALDLGADHVINHRNPLHEELQALGTPQVHAIASLTNTEQHLPALAEAIAPQGKIAVIDDPSALDIMPFKQKCVSWHWEFMFTRSLFQTEDIQKQHDLLTETARLIDAGRIKTTLAETFGAINATNLRRAHQLLESGKSRGKIVLAGFE
ncbi:MAG: zinc-binding alcohol dehydrogenase family protein [Verrucomicrobiota bacterium JB023]|nr:zinc-binding alcohol dehydrogenase family protein [Verrucomicrobiota bacterium JB023]